eukprot:5714798-Alexandrium_andersonii.AAC.1
MAQSARIRSCQPLVLGGLVRRRAGWRAGGRPAELAAEAPTGAAGTWPGSARAWRMVRRSTSEGPCVLWRSGGKSGVSVRSWPSAHATRRG